MRPVDESKAVAASQPPAASDDVFILPASFAQQRLWFLDKLEAGNGYNVPLAVRLKGPLRTDILERSLRELIARHEVLRTTFSQDETGTPVQVVAVEQPFMLATQDVRSSNGTSVEDEARRLVIEHFRIPFNLKQGPLFRAVLLRLGDEDSVLALAFHHSVVDGWSLGIFMRELSAVYEAFDQNQPSPLPDLPIQYGDYATWQHDSLRGERLKTLLTYWTEQLSGAPAILELPTDFPRPAVQTSSGAHESLTLAKPVEQALVALSQKEGATLFMTLLASYSLLLSRYSGQEEIVVGSPISGRTRSELENLIGFFVNTLAFRTDLSGGPSFRELLRRVRETALQAYAHQDLPFEKLVEELNPERNLSHTPIAQVMFTFESTAPRGQAKMSQLNLIPFRGAEGLTTKFDLSLNASLSQAGLTVGLTYNTDLFAPSTAKRMLAHFSTLLEAIAADPDQSIADLDLLTTTERQQVLVDWNQAAPSFSPDTLLHEFVQIQAKHTPDATALIDGKARISYRKLNARANQIARRLQKLGVGPEVLVAVCTERSADMIVALLAVLKAGGAYVPLDPLYPKERLAKILEDSHARVMITQEELSAALPRHSAEVLFIDQDWSSIRTESDANLDVKVTAGNLAYVLFTSGSTGRPKGVAIEHRSASIFVQWAQSVFSREELAGTLFSTSVCFDLSIFEMFVPLSVGGSVIIAQNALALRDLPAADKVRLINTVPSAIAELLHMGAVPSSVLTINLAGEALPEPLAREIYEKTSIRRLFNLYGPTEDTTYSSYALVPRTGEVTIGRPIANTQAYILDARHRPTPIGVPGELYLAGDGLARGYYGRDELTAERFVQNPFSPLPGARMYRTGDRCRFREDGTLQYLGRIDNQVKIRGFRIELGEIENLLLQHPAVQSAVVMAREDNSGDKRLAGYFVVKAGKHLDTDEAREFLRQALPDYMVPPALIQLDALPLTPNGKVDRNALPKPEVAASAAGAVVGPRDALEGQLLDLWKGVLQTPNVGITDNFFHLGGHSLMAARLVSEVEKKVGRKIPLAALFRGPTVESMAKLLREGTESAPDPIIMRIQAGSSVPFFAVVAPGRDAIGYAALAQAMGAEQTFYKLQSRRSVRADTPITLDDMKVLARDYIQAMRTVQPQGPYFLGGMCAGTHIAEQMIVQLEAEGERVALFAIFDTWVRQNSQVRWKWQVYYYRQRLHGLLQLSMAKRANIVRQVLSKKLRRIAHPLSKPAETSWSKLYWPGKGFTAPLFRAPIALFKRPRQPFYYMKDEAMGWSTRTLSRVEIHRIDFPHRMLREPYVRELAKRLLECISRANPPAVERLQVWSAVAGRNTSAVDART